MNSQKRTKLTFLSILVAASCCASIAWASVNESSGQQGAKIGSATVTKYIFPDGTILYSDKPQLGAEALGTFALPPEPPSTFADDSFPAEVDALPSRHQQPDGPLVTGYRHGNCRLAVYSTRSRSAFDVRIDGLEPGKVYVIRTDSEGESIGSKHIANATGSNDFLLMPEVLGKDQGIASVFVRSSRCVMEAFFHWGQEE